MLRRCPAASVLIVLHAITLVIVGTLFYTSHEPERQWVWIYAIMAGYPCSLVIRFLPAGAMLHLPQPYCSLETLQWGAVGAFIDSIVHRFRRQTASPYV